MMMDQNSLNLFLNVSRKFVPIGSKYLAPIPDDNTDHADKEVNKWGKKFKDVDKVMAWLCYDAKVHPKKDGVTKDYKFNDILQSYKVDPPENLSVAVALGVFNWLAESAHVRPGPTSGTGGVR